MAVLVLAALGSAAGAGIFGAGAIAGLGGITAGQFGWMAGSVLGNALFNKPADQVGPQIQDTKADAGAYGQGIHRVWGRQVVTGETIWQTDLKKTTHTQSIGKGGGATSTTYSYSCHMLVRLCHGPIDHVRKVWANGVLIYDSLKPVKQVDDRYIQPSDFRIYPGSITQLPDPTYEGVVGVGNAPAYRGYCYLSFTDFQLALTGNRAPVIKAEVWSSATATVGGLTSAIFNSSWSADGFSWHWLNPETGELWVSDYTYPVDHYSHAIRRVSTATELVVGEITGYPDSTEIYVYEGFAYNSATKKLILKDSYGTGNPTIGERYLTFDAVTGAYVSVTGLHLYNFIQINPFSNVLFARATDNDAKMYRVNADFTIGATFDYSALYTDYPVNQALVFSDASTGWFTYNTHIFEVDLTTGAAAPRYLLDSVSSWRVIAAVGGKLWLATTNRFATWNITSGVFSEGSPPGLSGVGISAQTWPDIVNGRIYFATYESGVATKFSAWDIALQTVTASQTLSVGSFIDWVTVTPAGAYWTENGSILHKWAIVSASAVVHQVPLSGIINDVSVLTGLTSGQIDVSECTTIMVDGYAVTGLSTGRGMLENILMAYQVDPVRSGYKIAFRTRDRIPLAALTRDDFLESNSSDKRMEIPGALEMPKTVIVGYTDGDSGEYGVATQPYTLQTVASKGTMRVDTAVVMTAAQAKSLAVKTMVTAWTENKLFRRSVPVKFAHLEPGDIVRIPVGSELINTRIQRITDAGIRRDLEMVSVSTDGYTQAIVGTGRLGVVPPSLGGVAIAMPVLINTPPLRSQDTGLFIYVAATHVSGSWFGGVLQKSIDQVHWEDTVTYESLAPSGILNTNLNGIDPITSGIDSTNKLNVSMAYGSLSSITQNDLLSGRNLAWLPDYDYGELIQYGIANQIALDNYDLSLLLRDRLGLGTASPHTNTPAFVMLDHGGMNLVQMKRSEVGKRVYFRILSPNQVVATAPIVSCIFSGRSVAPRAPSFVSLDVGRQGQPFVNGSGLAGACIAEWSPRSTNNFQWGDANKHLPYEQTVEKYLVTFPGFISDETGTRDYSIAVTARNISFSFPIPTDGITIYGSTIALVRAYSDYFGGYDQSDALVLILE